MDTYLKKLEDKYAWCCKAYYYKMEQLFNKMPLKKPEPKNQDFKNGNFFFSGIIKYWPSRGSEYRASN